MNLERVYAWLEDIPLAQTRRSHFEKMAHRKRATSIPSVSQSPEPIDF